MSATTSATTSPGTSAPDATTAAAGFIRFLETGTAPAGLFAEDMTGDVSLPLWRIRATSRAEMLAIRAQGHPDPGEATVSRLEPTGRGFTLEVEERWHSGGQQWYCREMFRADVVGSTIVDLAVYCTGDWDEARQAEYQAQA